MTTQLDHTHDPGRRSWVGSANAPDTDFPLQNLPLGVGPSAAGGHSTLLVAIGDEVLDAGAAARAGLLVGVAGELAATTGGPDRLNPVLAAAADDRAALRHALAALLERGSRAEEPVRTAPGMLRPAAEVPLELPTRIGSYTDFYAGIHHARAVSKILVPGGDVGPNYRWVPIAYQSRASTVRTGGAPVRRPAGQLKGPDADPVFAPCEKLDFELELGFYVGPPTELGWPVPIGRAADHIAGYCLLNDWSARDIQGWEMAPLGPFLSKSFATTVSPWVVTPDALAPFRVPVMTREPGDPAPLPYLSDADDQAAGGIAIALTVWIRTAAMRAASQNPVQLLSSDARHLYWTPAQMLAHHTSGGCDLQSGDLLGSGTISGPRPEQLGSLIELCDDGRRPATLLNGEGRSFLADGDEIIFTGRCAREGFVPIGFGACSGIIVETEG